MVYGLWFMVYGLWFMVYGLWFMVYGLWCMVYGVWFIVYCVFCLLFIVYDLASLSQLAQRLQGMQIEGDLGCFALTEVTAGVRVFDL
jgi:hypothetical protein